MQNYRRFSVKLNEYFKEDVKLSFVSTRNVIIVTKKDDKFYEFNEAFFNNHRNSLIAFMNSESRIKSTIDYQIVEELCNINVVDIKKGAFHKIVRTHDGHIYCWGQNSRGVLGNGGWDYNLDHIFRPELCHFLSDKRIIDIQCGHQHTLVLTSNHEVYAWGENTAGQIGMDSEDHHQAIPYHISAFNGKRVKSISCGYWHSMALTESGHVYSWGFNINGELGFQTPNTKKVKIPTLIEIENVTFQKICCSLDYNLFLSTDGDIYAFGSNKFGQLGTGDMENKTIPMKINHSEKFIDIATHYNVECISISCAQSESGVFYVWGDFEKGDNSEVINQPKETEYKSFNEIIAHYFHETYKPVEGPIIELLDDTFTWKGCYENLFYDEEFIGEGDFGKVFKVKDKYKKNEIYAVKMMLMRTDSENDLIEQLKELNMITYISLLYNERIVQYFFAWIQNYYIENGVKIEKLTLYIQMEYCEKNLTQIINEMSEGVNKDLNLKGTHFLKPLGYFFVVEIFIQIIEGVNYLHKRNLQIIHRDIKPANIMLTLRDTFGFVKLGDYGLMAIHKLGEPSDDGTKNVENDCRKHLHTTDIGDLDYCAPEVVDGEEYDTKADIYSTGRVLLDLFFINKQSYEYNDDYRSHIKNEMSQYHKIIQLWDKMMNKEPTDRPDCSQILRDRVELNLVEFDARKEFENVLKSHSDQNSFIFQLLKRAIVSENS